MVFLACLTSQEVGGQETRAYLKERAERLQVKAVVGKLKADGSQVITVTLSIDKGWYVYANPTGLGEDIDDFYQLTVKAQTKAKVKIDYPPGKEVEDKGIGKWRKYEGKVMIPVTVWRAKGDQAPLDLHVRFALRKGAICAVPQSTSVTVLFSNRPESKPKR